jgi:putative oxidoreductase
MVVGTPLSPWTAVTGRGTLACNFYGGDMTDERRSTATEVVYACLRVVASWVYLQHGLQKFGMLGGMGPNGGTVHFPTIFFWAGLIEVTCGTLILLGLATRIVAFIASGEMAFAYFMAHAPHGGPLFTIHNRGEVPAILAFLFLYVSLVGPGAYSLDAVIGSTRRPAAMPSAQVT